MTDTSKGYEIFVVQAESYEKCLEIIRKKYGRCYRITSTATVRCSGIKGLFGKEKIEVKYILSNDNQSYKQDGINPVGSYSKMAGKSNFKIMSSDSSESESINKALTIENAIKQASQRMNSVNRNKNQKPSSSILESEKSNKVEPQNKSQNSDLREVLNQVAALRNELAASKNSPIQETHETILKIEALLEKNEFSISYTKNIIERIRREFSIEQLDDFDEIQNRVVEWIGESVVFKNIEQCSSSIVKPHVIIVVGPTGVGKTTTIAKLAASFVMEKDFLPKWKRVRIITIDCFRLAAVQQINKYAELMDIPVSVSERAEDIKDIILNNRNDTDVFLIDTIGYSPKDYESIGAMRKILDVNGISTDAFLAFSASTKTSDLRDILTQYEIFDFKSVIVTKFDETNHIGNIISVLSEKNKAVSLITNGQKVPYYIENASVINFLLQLTDFHIDRNRIEDYFSAKMGELNGRSSV